KGAVIEDSPECFRGPRWRMEDAACAQENARKARGRPRPRVLPEPGFGPGTRPFPLLSRMCPVEDGYWILDVGCWEPPFRPGAGIPSELPSALRPLSAVLCPVPSALFPPTAPRSALPQTSGNTRCSPERKAAIACSSFQKSTQPTPRTPDGRQKSARQTRRPG